MTIHKLKALKCKPSALNTRVVASLYAGPCVINGASNTSLALVALAVRAITEVFQRLSYLL